MLSPLRDPTYRRLFTAQVVALLGTGLATVALALLAYDLAGERAGAVLGTALAIKMIAYVSVAPLAGAVAQRVPRRRMLVAMDLVRAAVVLLLPFVGEVWQIYVLIFVLQSASAAFTPTFQATIPDILEDEETYTRALSLSRLAYDLENLLSPTLAAAALALVSFHWLFAGTAGGFLLSAALVLSVTLPRPEPAGGERRSVAADTLKGLTIYLATPRLRGLLALNLAAASAGAMVIVNTVVIVKETLGGSDSDVAVAQAFFGGGSMLAALLLPRLLAGARDRTVMSAGAAALAAVLLALAGGLSGAGWAALVAGWAVLGLGYSAVLTPSGRLLRRSAQPADRPAVFAAQFALSHACWLLTYPLAGWLGSAAGMQAAFAALAVPAAAGLLLALLLWPAEDPESLTHVHTELDPDHPHLRDAEPAEGGFRHRHDFRIDTLHRRWPAR